VLDPDGAATPIGVSLDSPGSAGRVVFAAERNAQAANQLSLESPVDGTPVDFWGWAGSSHRAAPTGMPGSPFDRPPETSRCSPFH
jgi:hypothetical protein